MKPTDNLINKMVYDICKRAGFNDLPDVDYLDPVTLAMLLWRFDLDVGPQDGKWTACAEADMPIMADYEVLEDSPNRAACMCLIRREEARFREFTEFLHKLGWRNSCDAQSSEIRRAIPELHAMLTAQIFAKGETLDELVSLVELAAPYIDGLETDGDFATDWMERAKKVSLHIK